MKKKTEFIPRIFKPKYILFKNETEKEGIKFFILNVKNVIDISMNDKGKNINVKYQAGKEIKQANFSEVFITEKTFDEVMDVINSIR